MGASVVSNHAMVDTEPATVPRVTVPCRAVPRHKSCFERREPCVELCGGALRVEELRSTLSSGEEVYF